jgi:hypothetical protein
LSNEIRECPYCGGPAKLIAVYAPEKADGERYRYVCNGLYEEPTRMCPRHRTGTIEEATEAWNTRAAPASAAEPMERLPEWWQVWDEEEQEWVIGSSGQIAVADGIRMRPLYVGPEVTS